MTTIAVSRSLRMMAADSNMSVAGRMHRSDPKMLRLRECIAGFAGEDGSIRRLAAWLSRRKGKMPGGEREALILYKGGRIAWIGTRETYEFEVQDDHFAIGCGATHAIAAMDALDLMGLPVDPRIGVQVACRRDPETDEPVVSMRWRNLK